MNNVELIVAEIEVLEVGEMSHSCEPAEPVERDAKSFDRCGKSAEVIEVVSVPESIRAKKPRFSRAFGRSNKRAKRARSETRGGRTYRFTSTNLGKNSFSLATLPAPFPSRSISVISSQFTTKG